MSYFDVVKTPTGDEYAVEACRMGAPMMQGIRTSVVFAALITAFRFAVRLGRGRGWNVRVRPWRGPSLPSHIVHIAAKDQPSAESLAQRVADDLSSGHWKPGADYPV